MFLKNLLFRFKKNNFNSKKLLFGVIILAIIIYLIIEIVNLNSASKEETQVYFKIEKGQKSLDILDRLVKKKIIRNKYFSYFYIKITGLSIQPGVYYLNTNQSPKYNLQTISKGEVSEKKFTFIEGWRVEQYAQLLDQEGIIDFENFIETAQKHESKLYPDTYQIAIKTTSQIIVDKLLANYDQKMAENKINPSAEDLILASIVEREAKFDEDRAKIAGVFKNRLKIGMALEADPTVQYAQENNQKKDFEYWQELAIGDITINSPFNTYKVKGLPPAPICNPSIKSILAVINYEKNDYFYFIHDSEGKAHFAKNITEHNQNKQKYIQ